MGGRIPRDDPTLDEKIIQRELEYDPEGAQTEWLATFRTDLSAAFSVEMLEQCTVKGRSDLPPPPTIPYVAFVDPSGGKSDSFTVAIAHQEGSKAVIDVARAWPAPFDPGVVTAEIGELLKSYGVRNICGDNYAGEWPKAAFAKCGINYERCEKSKSELYLSLVPVTNFSDVELPDDKRLFSELRRLERKRGRHGRDSVDHPPRLRDDLANSVAGVTWLLLNNPKTQGRSDFNPSLHVSRASLRFVEGQSPLLVGVSHGDDITATVIGQSYDMEICVFAAFVTENISLRHHLEQTRAWLASSVRYRLSLLGGYEDNPDVNVRASMHQAIQQILGGQWAVITRKWASRLDQMRDVLLKPLPYKFIPYCGLIQRQDCSRVR